MAPVAQGWLRASLALWARLRSAPADSLLGMAVRLSLRMEVGSAGAKARPLPAPHTCPELDLKRGHCLPFI